MLLLIKAETRSGAVYTINATTSALLLTTSAAMGHWDPRDMGLRLASPVVEGQSMHFEGPHDTLHSTAVVDIRVEPLQVPPMADGYAEAWAALVAQYN